MLAGSTVCGPEQSEGSDRCAASDLSLVESHELLAARSRPSDSSVPSR
jgi:hypothetical protein